MEPAHTLHAQHVLAEIRICLSFVEVPSSTSTPSPDFYYADSSPSPDFYYADSTPSPEISPQFLRHDVSSSFSKTIGLSPGLDVSSRSSSPYSLPLHSAAPSPIVQFKSSTKLPGQCLSSQSRATNCSTSTFPTPFADRSGPKVGVKTISVSKFPNHTLLLTYCGEVYGWGYNYYGEVLFNGPQMVKLPVKLPISNIISISAGYCHSLALSFDGKLFGWGSNVFNQLEMSSSCLLPITLIKVPYHIKEIYCGHKSSFALTMEGHIIIWGYGHSYEFLQELNDIESLCTDGDSFVAIDSKLRVFYGSEGCITQVPVSKYFIPKAPSKSSFFLDHHCDQLCLFLVDTNGHGWQIDHDLCFNRQPIKYHGFDIVSISGCLGFQGAVCNNGRVYVWGELGKTSCFYQNIRFPSCFETPNNSESISVGFGFLYAYNKNTVWAWGKNDQGQLGTGDLIERHEPVKVFGSEILGSFQYSKQPLDRMFSGLIKLVYWEYLNYLKELFGNHPYVKARFYSKCLISKRLVNLGETVLNDYSIRDLVLLKAPQDLFLNQSIRDLQLRLSTSYNGPKVINTRIKKLDVFYDDADYDPQLLSLFPNVEVVLLGGFVPHKSNLNLAHLLHLLALELTFPMIINRLPTSLVKLVIRHDDIVFADLSYLTSLKELLLLSLDLPERISVGQVPLPDSIVRLELWPFDDDIQIKLPNLKELKLHGMVPTNITEQNFPSLKFIQLITPAESMLVYSPLYPTKLANQGFIKSVELVKNDYLSELSCFPWWIQYPAHRFINSTQFLTENGELETTFAGAMTKIMFDKGFAHYSENRYPEAVLWFTKAAAGGHVVAMSLLGSCYQRGFGVDENYQEAFRWYRKAAEAGSSSGMYFLGACYRDGEGVDQDHRQAFHWFKKAAYIGHPNAIYNLGNFCESGRGVEQDYFRAAFHYQKAAEMGHQEALLKL
ncbi:hypothetical protein P9112_012620 [Eukaryota sp. TZLM1-RC]